MVAEGREPFARIAGGVRRPGVYEPHEHCPSVVCLPRQHRWVVIRKLLDGGRVRRVVVFSCKYKQFNERSEKGARYRALVACGPVPTRLNRRTLEKLEGWMQTDHLIAPICDDPQIFCLMFNVLNIKFSFETLLEFKREFTGDGWGGAVELANSAINLQLFA